MRLSDARRDKISGIFEKIGIAVFLGAVGDIILGTPDSPRFVWDLLGIAGGLVLLTWSVTIIKK